MSYITHPQSGASSIGSRSASNSSFTSSVFDTFASPLEASAPQARHTGHKKARKHATQHPPVAHPQRLRRAHLPPGIEEQPF